MRDDRPRGMEEPSDQAVGCAAEEASGIGVACHDRVSFPQLDLPRIRAVEGSELNSDPSTALASLARASASDTAAEKTPGHDTRIEMGSEFNSDPIYSG